MDVVTLASEFPNDNPALHAGVSWVCLEVTGAPVAIAAPVPVPALALEPEPEPQVEPEPPPAPAPRISEIVAAGSVDYDALEDDDATILVEDLPPLDETASVEGLVAAEADPEPQLDPVEPETALPPACDDPFTILVASLSDIAIGAGSPYVASLLPALLLEGRIEHAMPDDAALALAAAGIAKDGEVTATFAARTKAWHAILSGTSDDFDACGAAMLDEWAAELLACLLGAPSRATALKRDLRARGIAAFGLVEAA